MLVMVFQLDDVVRNTLPLMSVTGARIPEGPTQDAWREMTAAAAVYGSAAVVQLLQQVAAASREFQRAVWYSQQIDQGHAPGSAHEARDARLDVEAKRTTFYVAVQSLEAAAREDLGS